MIDLKIAIAACQDWKNNPSQLRAILRDYYPNNRREVNVVLNVLESGIIDRIRRERIIDDITIEKYLTVLDDEYGIQQEAALEALEAWAKSLNVNWNVSSKEYDNESERESFITRNRQSAQPEEKLQIAEVAHLNVFIEDFNTTKSLKSCCSIIDILYKYATNLDEEFPLHTQQLCYERCLFYIEKLKKLPKRGNKEKAYNYLALYVEGALRFINADFAGAVKVYKECAAFPDFNDIEKDWPDDRIDVKIAVHSNLYFIYDFLGLDFGKSVEKAIVDKALQPNIDFYKQRALELKIKMQKDSTCADEEYNPDRRSALGKGPTNASTCEYYLKCIEESENWTSYPKFRYMHIDFSDYASLTMSDLAEAVYDNKWGGISISRVDEECDLVVENDSIILSEKWMFTKTVTSQLSSNRKHIAERIRLLYMR